MDFRSLLGMQSNSSDGKETVYRGSKIKIADNFSVKRTTLLCVMLEGVQR